MTFGSGGAGDSEPSRAVAAAGTNARTNAVELARRVLEAVQAGQVERRLLEQLADAVLADELVQLALAARAGGEHQIRRGLELATAVLAAELALDEPAAEMATQYTVSINEASDTATRWLYDLRADSPAEAVAPAMAEAARRGYGIERSLVRVWDAGVRGATHGHRPLHEQWVEVQS